MTLTKTQVEKIANGYLTQCYNNGTYNNESAFEWQQYVEATKFIESNF